METLTGVQLIERERREQMTREQWSDVHDDTHRRGELARAAACYALVDLPIKGRPRWPWSCDWWKPKSRLRNLIRAGALIAAEIDRLVRAGERP